MNQQLINTKHIRTNDGQIPEVPANPRTITKKKMEALKRSISELPDMLAMRELLVYPYDGKYIVLGGNMRFRACVSLGFKEVPCKVIPQDTPTEKLRRIVMVDNNPYGENDWDMLANEWDAKELDDWGVDVWQEPKEEEKPQVEEHPETNTDSEDEEADEPINVEDRLFDSNNEFDIPTLLLKQQPSSGLLLPFNGWGADGRARKCVNTYHFYVEDYRFTNIWKHPEDVINSDVKEVVEPNLSLFDTTPIAYGLQQIYMKRWLARYWQECGIKVYADLNVAKKFYKYNRLGIPDGYNAFCTRGYSDRMEYLKLEIQIAREISGIDKPNMMVYGGGEQVKELCVQNGVLYVEQFMANKVKKMKGE